MTVEPPVVVTGESTRPNGEDKELGQKKDAFVSESTGYALVPLAVHILVIKEAPALEWVGV